MQRSISKQDHIPGSKELGPQHVFLRRGHHFNLYNLPISVHAYMYTQAHTHTHTILFNSSSSSDCISHIFDAHFHLSADVCQEQGNDLALALHLR